MKPCRIGGRQQGFSTLEAAVSLAILALMLGTAVHSIGQSSRNPLCAKDRQERLLALRKRFRALKSQPDVAGRSWAAYEPLAETQGKIIAVEIKVEDTTDAERFLTFIVKPSSYD